MIGGREQEGRSARRSYSRRGEEGGRASSPSTRAMARAYRVNCRPAWWGNSGRSGESRQLAAVAIRAASGARRFVPSCTCFSCRVRRDTLSLSLSFSVSACDARVARFLFSFHRFISRSRISSSPGDCETIEWHYRMTRFAKGGVVFFSSVTLYCANRRSSRLTSLLSLSFFFRRASCWLLPDLITRLAPLSETFARKERLFEGLWWRTITSIARIYTQCKILCARLRPIGSVFFLVSLFSIVRWDTSLIFPWCCESRLGLSLTRTEYCTWEDERWLSIPLAFDAYLIPFAMLRWH